MKNRYNRNGYGHMMIDCYVELARAQMEKRKRRLSEINSRKQAEQYREYVRGVIKKSFSPLPEKTPLNARITGVLNRPGYRLEKVVFESRPGCIVTASLYVPENTEGPCPGVLAPCGHSANGKASLTYQEFCRRLVKAGFVVLLYDPINQGERDQYFNMPENTDVRKNCCYAHNMMGKQMQLVGEWFGIWRLWDGIRALDFLLDCPLVDKNRVGLTGNSGGGTMTTWLRAMDDRFTMSAPGCFVTSFLANLENELPADSEQYPPGVIGAGLDHADFLIAAAPDPVLLLGQKYDYFDRRGLKTAYGEIKRFYGFFGAEKNVQLFIGNEKHGYWSENQKNMTRFFCKHANLKQSRANFVFKGEKEKNLWSTKQGNTIPAGAIPVYELVAKKAEMLAKQRRKKRTAVDGSVLKRLLNIPALTGVPHYRVLRPESDGEISTARFAVETERNIRAIVRKKPAGQYAAYSLDVEKKIHVYLPDISAELDLADTKLAGKLTAKGPLYAIDVRGTGESMPDDTSGFFAPYSMDYMMHGYGLMLGENYLGRRVFDVLRVLKLLKAEGARDISLYGRRQGAILALFAAIIDPDITRVFLNDLPASFLSLTQKPVVDLPAVSFPFGILREFDIPDCLKALGKKAEKTNGLMLL